MTRSLSRPEPGPPLPAPDILHLPPPDALDPFVTALRPWSRHREMLQVPTTCGLWAVATASGVVGGWQVAVLAGRASCTGVVCTIASLGDHPRLLITLAGFCVATLLGLAFVTRGLTEADRPALGLMTVAAVAGLASLLGVVAVAALTLLIAAAAVVAAVALLDRS